MLRSLVGSEMCIRDSREGVGVVEAPRGTLIHHYEVDGKGAIERANLIVACLLYTSDAADDLLCVDLGGRRIIKKKKT
mgnify:CR=1 FL=1